MRMQSKVIRLDLSYNSEQSHQYLKETCYLAPFQDEDASHFAKRILTYLSLYELHPVLAKQQPSGRQPDLYLQDQQQHFLLWCQVDLPSEKQLQRASHQAEQVLLVTDSADQAKAKALIRGLPNVVLSTLGAEQLEEFCKMLRGHMQLSVWREQDLLVITDGQQQLEMQVAPISYLQLH
ncbi:YaeQ family protein [Rheinheimera sp.]|uniref:YaeQ family protein n=1 Tax=Rheinheimera sp. TaxID=1869214 RepID=UPI0027B9605B|nr:YaeQ family protein [Rheinheimera sp.]